MSPPVRRALGRILLGAFAVLLLLLWANARILALRERQHPDRPLVLSGYYVFHAMAAALEEGRVGQLDLTRYHEYSAAAQPLAPYRPHARQAEPRYVHYYTLDIGYSFIVELARLLFRSLPDNYYRALALQLVADFVTAVLVWRLFSEWAAWLGPLASLLFVVNRVFLDLVSFAYYYWWDVPMTLLLLGTLLLAARRPEQAAVWVAIGGAALGFGVWLRASWWPLGLGYFAALFLFRPLRRKLLVALLPFAILALPQLTRSSLARGQLTLSTRATWHVALVGLGYYPNPYGLDAKDETVFELTARKYGVRFRFEDYSGEHNVAARREYMELLKRDPGFVIGSVVGRLRESLLGTTRDSLAPYPIVGNIGYRAICALGLLLMIRRGGDRRLVGLAAAFAYLVYVGVTSAFYFVGLSYDSVSQAALLVLFIGALESAVHLGREALGRARSVGPAGAGDGEAG